MDKYTVDTVAFLSYLADALPNKVDDIFKLAEKNQVVLILPSIVLGEALYTIYKGKNIFGKHIPTEKIPEIFEILKTSSAIELSHMDLNSWEIFNELSLSEMHDRMIVAISRSQNAKAIITTDKEIAECEEVIW